MPTQSDTVSSSGSSAPLIGVRSEIYERRWDLIWMTRDDIETFEARFDDKTLFQNISLFCVSASIPLGIEKALDYWGGDKDAVDLAIFVFCACAFFIGLWFFELSRRRQDKLDKFKNRLFKEERRLTSTFYMYNDTSGGTHDIKTLD